MSEYQMFAYGTLLGVAGGLIVGYQLGLLEGIRRCAREFERLTKEIEEEQRKRYERAMERWRLYKEAKKSGAYQFLLSNYSGEAPYEGVVWRLMTEKGYTMTEAREALEALAKEGKIRIEDGKIFLEDSLGGGG